MFKSMKSIFNALMVIGILTSSLYSIEVKNGGVSGVNITAPSSKFNNLYIGAGSTVGDGTSNITMNSNGVIISSADVKVAKNINANTLTVGGTSYMSGAIRQVNGETIANGTDGFTTFSGAIRTEDGTIDSLGALILATNSNGAVNLRPQGTGDTAIAIDSDTDLIIGGISGTAAAIRSTWTATGLDLPGNLNVTGQVIASSQPCGAIQWYLNASSLTVINTAEVYELACGTASLDVQSAWFDLTTDGAGGTARLTCRAKSTRKYMLSLTGCLQTNSGNPTTPYIRVYQGGVWIPLMETSPYLSTQSKDTAFAVTGFCSLATDNYLDVRLSSDDGDDLFIDHMTLRAVPLD